MKRNNPLRLIIVLILALIVLFYALSIGLENLFPQPQKAVEIDPVPSVTPPIKSIPHHGNSSMQKRSARLSVGYFFQKIDSNLKAHQIQIAQCLLNNEDLPSGHFELSLYWDGTGKFKALTLNPHAGLTVEQCLKELIQRWDTFPHPGLQPFSYSIKLDL